MSEQADRKEGEERGHELASRDRKRLEARDDRREQRVEDLRKTRQHADRHVNHARLQQLARVDRDEIENLED